MKPYVNFNETLNTNILPNIKKILNNNFLPYFYKLVLEWRPPPAREGSECHKAFKFLDDLYDNSEELERIWIVTLMTAIGQILENLNVGVAINEHHTTTATMTWLEYIEYQGKKQRKEAGQGMYDSLQSSFDTIWRPWTTAKNSIAALRNPVRTVRGLVQTAYEQPVRVATNIMTGLVTQWMVGKVVGSAVGYGRNTYGSYIKDIPALEKAVNRAQTLVNERHNAMNSLTNTGGTTAREAFSSANSRLLASSEHLQAQNMLSQASRTLQSARNSVTMSAEAASKLSSTVTNGANFVGNNVTTLERIENQPKQILMKIITEDTYKQTRDYVLRALDDPRNWARQPERYDLNSPKNLVFAGGGVKGLLYISALMKMERENVLLNNISRIAGTSAGAMTALLLCVGWTSAELQALLLDFDLTSFLDDLPLRGSLLTLLESPWEVTSSTIQLIAAALQEHNGLFSGESLREWLADRVADKLATYSEMFPTREDAKLATFSDLAELQRQGHDVKVLTVFATVVSKEIPTAKCFSNETTPDVLIVDAVRMSMALPFIFYPHPIYIRQNNRRVLGGDGKVYADGGTFENYPIKAFDKCCYLNPEHSSYDQSSTTSCYNKETLGFRIIDNLSLYQAFLMGPELPERGALLSEDRMNSTIMQIISALAPSVEMVPRWLPGARHVISTAEWITSVKNALRSVLKLNLDLQLLPSIFFEAQQEYQYSDRNDWQRTVVISSGNIGTLDFKLTAAQKEEAMLNGRKGFEMFLRRARIAQNN